MPWITAVLGALVKRFLTWFMMVMSYRLARQAALISVVVIAYGVLFLGVVVAVKAIVMSARYLMPFPFNTATYFLPSNLPTILGTIVSFRSSIVIYNWMITNLSIYARLGTPNLF